MLTYLYYLVLKDVSLQWEILLNYFEPFQSNNKFSFLLTILIQIWH
jgi:hypothetical protein